VRFGALDPANRDSLDLPVLEALTHNIARTALRRSAKCDLNAKMRNMNEQFRTVAEVAEMLGLSKDTVRRLFADETGVIDLGRHEPTRGKRRYRVPRIPSAVVARFLERRCVK
jgi:excisionase family DNA binding protein